MNKITKSVLCGLGLTLGLAASASAADLSGVPYWSFTQTQPTGEMYFFVNVGPGQIAYYVGDNFAIPTMIDNAGHAAASIDINVDGSSKITYVGGAY